MTYDQQDEYFGFHQNDMNYNSIWSCDLEFTRLDQVMYEGEWEGSACKGDGQQKITYEVISKDATIDEIMNNTAEKIVFKAYVIGNTVKDFWRAAEYLITESAIEQDNHHRYVEGFDRQADGSFELVTGS